MRARLRPDAAADADYRRRVGDLPGRLDDDAIALAISGTRELSTAWARLPAGGSLRLRWPPVMMALADVLTRLVIIYLRGQRLAGPAATAVRTPAGIRA